jgi:predicted AAA+ superfamily ATPase
MRRYIEEGGFPDVQGEPYRIRVKMLQEYVDAVLYRDIIERHEVSSVQALRYTLDYILSNFAHKVSTRAIANALKQLGVSSNRECIADYLEWMEQAYLIYRVSLHSDSVAVRRMNPDKFYLVDTGLARAATPKNDASNGWFLENLVFMSLRRGDNKIEYYNTEKGEEVDFLVTDRLSKRRRLIQVAWDISSEETLRRELKAITTAGHETGISDLTIVTLDDEREIEGVSIVPVWKWSMNP